MKFLLLAVVLWIAWSVWRSNRVRREPDPPSSAKSTPALPQDMVRCPVCSLHLPRPDAVAGTSGKLYCCAEHRRSGGD
ncbi:PP0621 family protein [Ramlibacter humi]|uniref:Preprotein translocase subunit YajC n=1 Tax=Ramlibacter humi TaxID=2530451 RepID=A0A4Z0BY18_9BURK|nr:PP0621 family protein [Ramlibacter humi]TFZ04153.1 hypothetical protein EZ216_08145 [Ramlibacter humi]